MKTHNEFMEDVEHVKSLPAQTCRALGPESNEDIAMYIEPDKKKLDMIRVYIKESWKAGDDKAKIEQRLRKLDCTFEEIGMVFDELKQTEGDKNGNK